MSAVVSSRPVLVMGARGRVGREVLKALAHRGAAVRALVRKPSTGPAGLAGVTEVVGDLRDGASLRAALDGVASAFFVTPHDEQEEQLGLAFLAAARDAGVRRVVFASAYHPALPNPLAFRLFVAAMGVFTHYGPKLRVEGHVRRCGLSPVVLMPSNFFQNDELFTKELLAGEYPQPLGTKGVNRVDCADIGEAAARALTDEGVNEGAWPLVGPDATLTGPECAAAWSQALGREVRYAATLERWRALAKDRMHPRELEDFGKTYALFHRAGVAATEADLARTAALLGRPPRAYATYVAEQARAMTGAR